MEGEPMSPENTREQRYALQMCLWLGKPVWVARERQSDGKWRVVGCLDRNPSCAGQPCEWMNPSGRTSAA
jgi:hypothetical protein